MIYTIKLLAQTIKSAHTFQSWKNKHKPLHVCKNNFKLLLNGIFTVFLMCKAICKAWYPIMFDIIISKATKHNLNLP